MSNFKEQQYPSVVKKYSISENIDIITAEQHFNALKDFLKLAVTKNKPCFPSSELDKIWHTFILFTYDYSSFCHELGKFVHHIPFVEDEDRRSNFAPGYFCYISDNKLNWKFIRSLNSLKKISNNLTDCKANCGSGGDCQSSCSNRNMVY